MPGTGTSTSVLVLVLVTLLRPVLVPLSRGNGTKGRVGSNNLTIIFGLGKSRKLSREPIDLAR
jgi:hypothetical protein